MANAGSKRLRYTEAKDYPRNRTLTPCASSLGPEPKEVTGRAKGTIFACLVLLAPPPGGFGDLITASRSRSRPLLRLRPRPRDPGHLRPAHWARERQLYSAEPLPKGPSYSSRPLCLGKRRTSDCREAVEPGEVLIHRDASLEGCTSALPGREVRMRVDSKAEASTVQRSPGSVPRNTPSAAKCRSSAARRRRRRRSMEVIEGLSRMAAWASRLGMPAAAEENQQCDERHEWLCGRHRGRRYRAPVTHLVRKARTTGP